MCALTFNEVFDDVFIKFCQNFEEIPTINQIKIGLEFVSSLFSPLTQTNVINWNFSANISPILVHIQQRNISRKKLKI